jgi:hypothetical protein
MGAAVAADEVPPERTSPGRSGPGQGSRKRGDDGEPLHSFATLLDALAALTRDTIVLARGPRSPSSLPDPSSSAVRF